MGRGDNSDVMKHVVKSFVHVISAKTSTAHAWLTMKTLLKKLGDQYSFIKNI